MVAAGAIRTGGLVGAPGVRVVTALVAVRLVVLLAATLLRLAADGSAALTIRSTPSSISTWLRLRMTFFHLVTGIWSASKA